MTGFKIICTLMGIFLTLSVAQAQAPDTLWTKTYGGVNSDECFEMCLTSDSGFALVGFTNSFGAGDWDVYLLRTDKYGDTLWTHTYGASTDEYAHCICASLDGGFVIGGVQQSGDYDIYVVKTDSLGIILWTKTYGGMMNDMADGICRTLDQGYLVTGAANVNNYLTSGSLALLKLDANGDTAWVKTYGGTGYDFGSAICPTTDGGYAICGITNTYGSGGSDIWLLKTDANGDTLWTKTFGGNGNDEAWALAQTTDGGFILTGYTGSYGAGNWDVYVVKTNSSGDSIWTKTIGGPQYDVGMSVIQTADSGYIVAGTLNGNTEWVGGDLWLVKLNADGDTVWTRSLGGNAEDWGYSVIQTADNGYAIGGKTWSFGAGQCDVFLARYGPDTGIEEYHGIAPERDRVGATILRGRLILPANMCFRVFDIMGRRVEADTITSGIYFIEQAGEIVQVIIKIS